MRQKVKLTEKVLTNIVRKCIAEAVDNNSETDPYCDLRRDTVQYLKQFKKYLLQVEGRLAYETSYFNEKSEALDKISDDVNNLIQIIQDVEDDIDIATGRRPVSRSIYDD